MSLCLDVLTDVVGVGPSRDWIVEKRDITRPDLNIVLWTEELIISLQMRATLVGERDQLCRIS